MYIPNSSNDEGCNDNRKQLCIPYLYVCARIEEHFIAKCTIVVHLAQGSECRIYN